MGSILVEGGIHSTPDITSVGLLLMFSLTLPPIRGPRLDAWGNSDDGCRITTMVTILPRYV